MGILSIIKERKTPYDSPSRSVFALREDFLCIGTWNGKEHRIVAVKNIPYCLTCRKTNCEGIQELPKAWLPDPLIFKKEALVAGRIYTVEELLLEEFSEASPDTPMSYKKKETVPLTKAFGVEFELQRVKAEYERLFGGVIGQLEKKGWQMSLDSTVGWGELQSPVFRVSEENVQKVARTIELLQSITLPQPNGRSGLHVHVSPAKTVGRWLKNTLKLTGRVSFLLEALRALEDIVPFEFLFGRRPNEYCRKIEGLDRLYSKYVWINLQRIQYSSTIELRIPHSHQCDPEVAIRFALWFAFDFLPFVKKEYEKKIPVEIEKMKKKARNLYRMWEEKHAR